jgi:MoaA/NifB/PqqE/SkfB family radical SAM enzyme
MRATHGWDHVSDVRKREIIESIASGHATAGPVHAELDVTDRCNVACYFCNQQDVRTKSYLSLNCIEALLRDLVAGGLRSVRLSGGGDPLFHPQILEILELLAASGVVVDNLTTNGVALTPGIARALIEGRAREVLISLNASNADDYARMMRVKSGLFDKVRANVTDLLKTRGGGLPVVVLQFLLDRKNFAQMGEMYHVGLQLGADRIAIGTVTQVGDSTFPEAGLLTDADAESLRPYFEGVIGDDLPNRRLEFALPFPVMNSMIASIRKAVSSEVEQFPTAPSFQEANGGCFFGWYSVTVTGNGDLYPCCLTMAPTYAPLGNVVKDPGILGHWQGAAFGELRSEMRDVLLSGGRIVHSPDRFTRLVPQCVETGRCYLKNGYFRADEAFYQQLGTTLAKARRREIGIADRGKRRLLLAILEFYYRRFNDRTRPLRLTLKRRFGLRLTRSD